jgi:hypothetical protein
MLYRRLADLVVVVHCLVGVYLLAGGFVAWAFPWTALAHLPLAVWVSMALVLGWPCPLTPLENWLRKAAGEQGYQGGFIDHYLGPFVTPPTDAQTSPIGRRNEIALSVVVCILTVLPHCAALGTYHDAIWPLPARPAAVDQSPG